MPGLSTTPTLLARADAIASDHDRIEFRVEKGHVITAVECCKRLQSARNSTKPRSKTKLHPIFNHVYIIIIRYRVEVDVLVKSGFRLIIASFTIYAVS